MQTPDIDQIEDLKKENARLRLELEQMKDKYIGADNKEGGFDVAHNIGFTDIHERTEAFKKMEQEIFNISKFPEENPNPVLRINQSCTILYANKASNDLLEMWDTIVGGNVPERWCPIFKETIATELQKTVEISCNQIIYSFVITPVIKSGYINLYGRDITEGKRAEEEVRTRVTEIEAILSCIADGVLVYDMQGRITRSNSTADNILKLCEGDKDLTFAEREAKRYRVWTENGRLLAHEEMPAFRATLHAETITNKLLLIEVQGKSSWINMSAAPLFVSGKHSGGVVSMSDVTERKKAENILSRERELFAGIFNNIPVMIAIYDPEFKNFNFNREYKNILGWTEKDAAEGNFMSRVYPDPDYREKVTKYMQSLEPGWKEWRVTTKNGSTVDSSWANVLLSSGVQIGIGIDIRERKHAELKLSEQAYFITSITETIPDMVSVIELPSLELRYINREPFSLQGFDADTIMKMTLEERSQLVHPDDATLLSDYFNNLATMENDRVIDLEYRAKNFKGEWMWFHSRGKVFERNSDGKTKSCINVLQNISAQKEAEEKLRENEQRLQSIFNNAAIGIVIVDTGDRFIEVNNRLCEILGYSREELLGKTVSDLTAPEDIPISEDLNLKLHRGELELIDYEKRYLKADGTPLWVHVTVSAIRDSQGEHVNSVGTVEDISERKKIETEMKEAEDTLRKSREELSSITNNSPDVIARFDRQMRHLFINPYGEKVYGKTREEIIGKSSAELGMPLDKVAIWKKYFEEIFATGKQQNIEFEFESPTFGHQYFLSVFVPEKDEKGQVISILAITREITSLKLSEEKLRENEERFRTLADNISQIAWTADDKGKVLWYNKRWVDYTGVTLEQMQKGAREKVHHPDFSQRVLESFHRSINSGEPWEYTYPLRNKTGEFRWFLARALPIRDENGKITLWFGTNTDIHEQKLAEEKAHAIATEIEAILSCIPDGVLVYNNEGLIVRSNSAAENMLKYPKNESKLNIPQRVSQHYKVWTEDGRMLKPEEMPAYRAAVMAETATNEILLLEGHEQSRWFIFNAAPLFVSGKHTGAVLSMLEITSRKLVEEKLRESEERFRLLADNISQMAWITDSQGKSLWFNKRWLDFTGLSLEEMQSDGRINVVHPDYYDKVLKGFQQSIKNGEPWEDTYPMRSKDNEFRWFLSRALPIRDENGKITLWFGTNTDITEQRKIEDALRENEQRLQGVFDKAAIGIVEIDIENRFIKVNDRICAILGYTRDELLGKSVSEITAPEYRSLSNNINLNLHQGEFDLFTYEKQYLKKDGTPLWVNVTVSAIHNAQGDFIKSIGTVEDISKRKFAEEKLHEALSQAEEGRNILTALMQYIPLGITIADAPDVNIRLVSRYGQDLLDRSNEEITGIPAPEHPSIWGVYRTDGVTPGTPEELPLSRATMKGEIVKNEEWFVTRKDGTLIPILCNAAPILDKEGKVVGGVIGWQDIADIKKIEQEMKQRNEELTRFIYTVSHDLKSPLVTIKMFTSYLRDDIKNDDKKEQEKDLNYVENAADKMGKLLDELLELSRIGRKEQYKTEVLLETIVQNVIDLLAGRIREKNVEVIITAPPILLFGFYQRLIQLFQNLLDNAAKFMGNQPSPRVEIGAITDRSKEVIFFVRDNGLGIDPQYHDKLFGLFEKLDPATEGTGIGLALVKRIVEVHDGSIWFTSEGLGKGTTFYFTLGKTKILKNG